MTPADRLGRRVALASIFTSAALAAAKVLVGIHARSTSVVSSGVESAADVLASGLVFFGLWMAAKPPDQEHPYGHGRVETLSALAVGTLLVVTGSLICYHSLQRADDEHVPATFAIWPLVAAIVVKAITWSLKRYYGRRMRSTALVADSWNDAVDVLSDTIALVAVGIAVLHPAWAVADHYGAFVLGIIIGFVGVNVVRETVLQLMDTAPDPDKLRQIRAVAASVSGALGIEKCFARRTGLQYYVDLHLEVDPHMTVMQSHEIATEVRFKIKRELDWVADVLVHVEPFLQVLHKT